jgi:hypothetical protein
MLDVIFQNRVFDLGDACWWSAVRDGIMAGMFGKNDRNLTSKIDTMRNNIEKEIEKIQNLVN